MGRSVGSGGVAAMAPTATGAAPTTALVLATDTVPPAQPTATTPPAQAIATPLPAHLQVSQSPSSGVFNCAGSTSMDYPIYTVHNSGGKALSWLATTNDPWQVMVSPASGTVALGGSTSVHLSGNATVGTVTVTFTSDGVSVPFAVECGKP